VGVLLLVVLVLKLLDSICSRRPSKNSKITEFLLLSWLHGAVWRRESNERRRRIEILVFWNLSFVLMELGF
jgi:hypothetical protein